jgi:surface antigen
LTISHANLETLPETQAAQTLPFLHRKRRQMSKLARQRALRYGLIVGNLLVVAAIVFFVQRAQNTPNVSALAASSNTQTQNDPLDQLSSADIAVNLAEMTNLPEETSVNDHAITVDSELAVAPADNTVVAKPQQVATTYASRDDIKTYIAQAGDSVASVAAKFSLTANSVMWSNGLTTNTVKPGMKLLIPPVNGIVYTVKAGDTAASLAQKYQSNAAQIISYNDAEISGLQPGEQILIPGGQQPASASSVFGASGESGIVTATYGGFGMCTYQGKSYSNYGYDCGFCTWWVAMRRATAGDPVPSDLGDASSWRYRALSIGMSEGTTPRAGAVMWFTDDHVAYVESVAADGTVTISEMNHEGWGIENTRTFTAAEAATHVYIY